MTLGGLRNIIPFQVQHYAVPYIAEAGLYWSVVKVVLKVNRKAVIVQRSNVTYASQQSDWIDETLLLK